MKKYKYQVGDRIVLVSSNFPTGVRGTVSSVDYGYFYAIWDDDGEEASFTDSDNECNIFFEAVYNSPLIKVLNEK